MRSIVSVIALGLAVAASVRAEEQSAPVTKSQKIGVVNTTRVLKNFDYANQLGRDLLKDQERAETKARDKQAMLASVSKESFEEKDSARRLDLQKEAIRLQQELQVAMVGHQKEYNDRREKMALETFQRIRQTVAELAKERGYDLILSFPGPQTDADLDTPQVAMMSLTSGSMLPLFTNREHDLTDEVVNRLNKKYPTKAK